jgi:peptidoglycan/LPS O-acetylase OafA/YrhL
MTKENRYRTLDSLRGILSLTVVLGHCFNSITALSWVYEQSSAPPAHNIFFFLAYSPLHFLVNGQKAVILFFVLSGFVLSIPFYKKDITKSQYFIFFIKRILRLYLPCLGIIVIAMLVKLTYYNPGATINYGAFIKGFLSDTLSANQLLKSFLLRGPETNFVPVLWTLSIEIKLSLILPFFVYVLRRLNVKWSVSIIGAIIIFNMIIKRIGVYANQGSKCVNNLSDKSVIMSDLIADKFA